MIRKYTITYFYLICIINLKRWCKITLIRQTC